MAYHEARAPATVRHMNEYLTPFMTGRTHGGIKAQRKRSNIRYHEFLEEAREAVANESSIPSTPGNSPRTNRCIPRIESSPSDSERSAPIPQGRLHVVYSSSSDLESQSPLYETPTSSELSFTSAPIGAEFSHAINHLINSVSSMEVYRAQ